MKRKLFGLLRRVGLLILVVWTVVSLVTILIELVPGDQAVAVLGEQATPEQLAQFRTRANARLCVRGKAGLAGAVGPIRVERHHPACGNSWSSSFSDIDQDGAIICDRGTQRRLRAHSAGERIER